MNANSDFVGPMHRNGEWTNAECTNHGCNRGLGLEFVRQYLADGWRAYAACRNSASASELRRLAEGSDDKLRILAMDVTDPASIHAAATQLDGQAIDLLLNNAGEIDHGVETIGDGDYEAWAAMLAVNTMGPMPSL